MISVVVQYLSSHHARLRGTCTSRAPVGRGEARRLAHRKQVNLFQAVSPHTIRGHKAWRCTALKRLQPLLMSGLSRHQARTSCRRYPRKQVSPLIHALAVAGQSAPSPSASTAPASELHLSPQRRLRSHFWMQPRRRIEAHLWLEEAQQCCKVLRARIAFLRVCAVAPTAF